jgi:LacI family transcriptional regulator
MREVADRAGVAMSSVSRVLSGHPDVSPQMEATVMAAVRELGYRPDLLAQSLRSQRTYSIGFTLSDISNPVLAEVVTGSERRLRAAGYSLLLTDAEGRAELDASHIRLLEQRRVDGYLLSLADEHHARTAEVLRQLDVPVVLLDRDLPTGVTAARVCFDHRAGMGAAVEHLLGLGHRHIALITGGPRRPARQRRAAIEEKLAEYNDGAYCGVYEGDFSIDYGSRAALEIVHASERPTAIIAAGNMLMHGALRALHESGIQVGEGMSFVGCDDVAIAELHQPPIAVVRRDNRRLGECAAELLLAELDSDAQPNDIELPTEFVARPSCRPVSKAV